MSVLESDFDLQDETIESLFGKIDRISEELSKHNPEQAEQQDRKDRLLEDVRKSVEITVPLTDGDN